MRASSLARLGALVRIQRVLSETLDPALVAQRVGDSLRELLSVRFCTVFRRGEREEDLYGVAASGDAGRGLGADVRFLDGTGVVGAAVRERRPIATPNLLADARVRLVPEVRERLEGATFRSVLAVPLVARNRLIGALGVGDVEGRVFTPDDIELTEAFAGQAALAMETARLYDEARRGQRSAEIVDGLVSSITASLDLDTVLQRVVEGARELCDADLVRIALRESGSPLVVHRVGVGPSGFAAWLRPAVGPGEGSGGWVLATERPFRTDDYQADARIADQFKHAARPLGTVAHMVVPIRTGARIDGLIYVSRVTRRPFTERDETQLGRLADHAAIAIDHARLFTAEQAARVEAQAAVAALAESEQRYRDLVENASDAVFTLDLEGRFTAVNEGVARLTGYGRDDLLTMGIESLLRPDDLRRARRQLIAVSDRPAVFECELLARDGHAVPIEVCARQLSLDGQLLAVHGIARDVTERHRQEGELRQVQKMEAIGLLAGGIAHDFNNLLTVIGGRADLLLARLPEGSRARGDAKLIKDTAERAAGLTRQLLAFSRRQVLQPTLLDLRSLITGMETLLHRLLGEDIRLVIDLPARLALVRADRSQLEQVVMNLAVNARDAMPRGGLLTIEAATHEGEAPAGRHVRLTMADTGEGMDEGTRARVFEPFFTTKTTARGTGLGLATVYGIVAQSGGRITVDSTVGGGTAFTIDLPAEGDEPLEAPLPQPGDDLRGVESVLLVEDEPAVRDLAHDVLADLGYRVLTAAGAEEGVRAMRTHAGRIDLVLTDVVMPDGSGREMVDRLRALRADFKVLYMSGYTDDAVIQRGLVTSEVAFLQKPFTPAGLARRVREVLDADPQRQ